MACPLTPGAEEWFNNLPDEAKLKVIKYIMMASLFICKNCALNQAYEIYNEVLDAEKVRQVARFN